VVLVFPFLSRKAFTVSKTGVAGVLNTEENMWLLNFRQYGGCGKFKASTLHTVSCVLRQPSVFPADPQAVTVVSAG